MKSLFLTALAATISCASFAQKGELTPVKSDESLTEQTNNSTEYHEAMKASSNGTYSQLVVETSKTEGQLVEPLSLVTFNYEIEKSTSSEDAKNLTTTHQWNLTVNVELWGDNVSNGTELKDMSNSASVSFSLPFSQDVVWALNSPTWAGCWGTFIWCKDFDKPSYLGRAQPLHGVELYGKTMVSGVEGAINNAVKASNEDEAMKALMSAGFNLGNDADEFVVYLTAMKNAKVSAEEIIKPISRSTQSVKMQLEAIAAIKHSSVEVNE